MWKFLTIKGLLILESLYQLELNGDELTFSIIYYVNGIFIGDEKRSLTRD